MMMEIMLYNKLIYLICMVFIRELKIYTINLLMFLCLCLMAISHMW